jgi:hypothetical protein
MFDGFGKIHILDFLHECECRAARLTTKAVKHPLGRRYGKRGGLFAVEGTSANQIGARTLERDVATDKFFDVGSVNDLLYKIFGKSHRHSSSPRFAFVKNFDAL